MLTTLAGCQCRPVALERLATAFRNRRPRTWQGKCHEVSTVGHMMCTLPGDCADLRARALLLGFVITTFGCRESRCRKGPGHSFGWPWEGQRLELIRHPGHTLAVVGQRTVTASSLLKQHPYAKVYTAAKTKCRAAGEQRRVDEGAHRWVRHLRAQPSSVQRRTGGALLVATWPCGREVHAAEMSPPCVLTCPRPRSPPS